jgi:uncharacterized protein
MERDLIEYIAKNLVNDPDQVKVELKEHGSATDIQLNVAQKDMGRVIGRQGRVANAMRSLLRVIGNQQQKRINLDID